MLIEGFCDGEIPLRVSYVSRASLVRTKLNRLEHGRDEEIRSAWMTSYIFVRVVKRILVELSIDIQGLGGHQ